MWVMLNWCVVFLIFCCTFWVYENRSCCWNKSACFPTSFWSITTGVLVVNICLVSILSDLGETWTKLAIPLLMFKTHSGSFLSARMVFTLLDWENTSSIGFFSSIWMASLSTWISDKVLRFPRSIWSWESWTFSSWNEEKKSWIYVLVLSWTTY